MNEHASNLRRTRADMLGTDDEEHYSHCHDAATEIERLFCEGKIANERFDLAQKCINQIDDLLEYAYRRYSTNALRDRIMGLINDYGVVVSKEHNNLKTVEHNNLKTVADSASEGLNDEQADKVRWEYEQGLDGPEHERD